MSQNLKYINNENKSKMNTKDLISLGMYNLLIILLMGVGVGACAVFFSLAFDGQYYFAVFTTVGTGFFAAPAFSIIFNKIRKNNAVLISTFIQAVFLLLSGHAAIAFFVAAISGVIAEYYFRRNNEYLSYLAYTLGGLGSILPLYFMRTSYVDHLTSRGYEVEKIQFILNSSGTGVFINVVAFTIIFTLLGTYLARKIYFRNFDKAGI